jgi:hypothetical protein
MVVQFLSSRRTEFRVNSIAVNAEEWEEYWYVLGVDPQSKAEKAVKVVKVVLHPLQESLAADTDKNESVAAVSFSNGS